MHPHTTSTPTLGRRLRQILSRREVFWPVLILIILRIPSFFEPHWYTDEAGYASTVYFIHLGKEIYVTAWNNKPPLLFALYALDMGFLGTSEAALHVLPFLTGLMGMGCALCLLNMAPLSTRSRLVCGIVLAGIFGTPMLNAELALPESLLIAPVTGAMLLYLWSARRHTSLPTSTLVMVALLLASAVLIQQTALAECSVLLLFLLVRRQWRHAIIIAGTGIAALAIVLIPTAFVTSPHAVWYALATSYLTYVNASFSSHLILVIYRLGLVALFLVSAWWGRNGKDSSLEFMRLWASGTLVTSIAPGYPYSHFLLPAAIPTVTLVAMLLAKNNLRSIARNRLLHVGASALLLIIVVIDGVHIYTQPNGFTWNAAWAIGYYPVTFAHAFGIMNITSYDSYFDTNLQGQEESEAYITSHHLDGSTAVIWSNLAWPYLDNQLKPVGIAGPIYVPLNVARSSAPLIAHMETDEPTLIIVSTQEGTQGAGAIARFLADHTNYHKVTGNTYEALYVRVGPPVSGAKPPNTP